MSAAGRTQLKTPPGFLAYSPFSTTSMVSGDGLAVTEAPATTSPEKDAVITTSDVIGWTGGLMMSRGLLTETAEQRDESRSPSQDRHDDATNHVVVHGHTCGDDESSSVHNVSRDDASVESQGSQAARRKASASYSMLGERVADIGYRQYTRPGEALWTPLERPESAPLPIDRTRETSNLALLVSSLQELTTVVARQGEEIRELKQEVSTFSHRETRIQDACAALNSALRRVESRLTHLDRRLFLLEEASANCTDTARPKHNRRQQVSKDQLDDINHYAWPPAGMLASDITADAFNSRSLDTANAYLDPYSRIQSSQR